MPDSAERCIFLGEVEANPQPGPYADAIAAAKKAGTEYWGIWNILAFRPQTAYHLCELSHELMFEEAPISPALRELIAAYTSSLNGCEFCMNAHASVASHLYIDQDFVRSVLSDLESSALAENEKALLRFVRKLTLEPGSIAQSDIDKLKAAGWDDTSIYYAIGVCALFNFYNRFVSGNGVKQVSEEAFRRLGERMARAGYSREQPPNLAKGCGAEMREASPQSGERELNPLRWMGSCCSCICWRNDKLCAHRSLYLQPFLNPLHAAFGWQREAIGGTFALAAITVALGIPGIGVLLDRFAPRRIILPAILIFALALASLSRLGPNITQFYFTYFVLGLVANGTAQFAYTRTMLTWFRKHRGFVLALILTGSGVGSIIIPPLTQWTIEHHGWRNAYILLGGIALVGFPLTALLVRNRPAVAAMIDRFSDSGATVGAAMRSIAFWVLALITALSAFSENGLVTNMAAILTEHGVTAHAAALALSVRGGAGIIGRLGVGLLIDRFSPQRIQTYILVIAASGTLILAFAGTTNAFSSRFSIAGNWSWQ